VTSGRLLAVTGGHRFDLVAFSAMLDAVCEQLGWAWAHATQPAAQHWMVGDHAGTFDAILLHDLPGLDLARGREPRAHAPSDATRRGVIELLEAGQGIVATHHALAGWPAWDGWASALGGRFLYAPGSLRSRREPSSGYRMDAYAVEVVAPDHPVCAGVETFDVDDELYLCPVFEAEVVPLLATRADIAPETMISTYDEVSRGEQLPAASSAWGSQLLGWAKAAGASPLVYLLPGHGPTTMERPQYRRLLANACAWVASPSAHAWARAQPSPISME